MPDYWIDTDSFIRAKNEAYGFDLAPGFWKLIDQKVAEGIMASSTWNYHEIVDEGTDDLAVWARQRETSGLFIEPNEAVQLQFKKIAEYVNSRYRPHKAQEFLAKADAWLIAHAKISGGRVVTFEGRADPNSTSPDAKIPDVADAFDVKCVGLWKMLRELHVSFDLLDAKG
jgi:hypothetical protein